MIIIAASEDSESKSNAAPPWSTPCLQVELENEDPLSAKKLKISGKNKKIHREILADIFDLLTSFDNTLRCSLQPPMPPLYLMYLHRVEGRWADFQSDTEDVPLLEQAAEPSVSTELTASRERTGSQPSPFGSRLFGQVLAGGTDGPDGRLPHGHGVTVLQPQVGGFCCETLWQKGCRAAQEVSTTVRLQRHRSNTEGYRWSCSSLLYVRAVTLEGNHLPERSYHLLLSEDSVWVTKCLLISQNLFNQTPICIHKEKSP